MADIVSAEKRSQMMGGIKWKDTKPEKMIRSGIWRSGLRFKLHQKSLPGSPDLVFPRFKAVLFVHGCFFHGHECHIFKWPKDNAEFWHKKITGNRARDITVFEKLLADGWRVGVVWECAVKGKHKAKYEDVIEACRRWIFSEDKTFEFQITI